MIKKSLVMIPKFKKIVELENKIFDKNNKKIILQNPNDNCKMI